MKPRTYKTTQAQRDRRKRYVLAHPERVKAQNAAWRKSHPEYLAVKREQSKAYYAAKKSEGGAGFLGARASYMAEWRKQNPETVREMERRAWVKNKPSLIAKHRRWKAENPEQWAALNRKSDLKNKFSMTPDDYLDMLAAQGGKCAICETTEPRGHGNVFSVDHDHETGAVRALLCVKCNTGLGMFKDSYELLGVASEYVWKHGLRRHLRVVP